MTAPQKEPAGSERAVLSEVALIEKTALRVGMKSLMNHGAASCVYTEGCDGVSQEHLISFAREVALHCVVTLGSPASLASPSSGGWMPIAGAPKDGSEFLAIWGRQGNVVQVVKWNRLHKFWESKGEPVTGFAANATGWHALPPAPKSSGESHE